VTTRNLKKQDAERATIMRAAFQLIGQSELGATSVQDILERAGLSTRAFYRQFGSKDDLIIAMYRAESDRVVAALAAAVADAPDPRGAVEAWMDQWLSIAYDPRRATRIRTLSSGEARNAAGFREAQLDTFDTSTTIVQQVLLAGQRSGDFPTVHPDHDARAMQAIMMGLVDTRHLRRAYPTWAEARDRTADLFARILGYSRT
jgi:AcrR family transcriptional regulator